MFGHATHSNRCRPWILVKPTISESESAQVLVLLTSVKLERPQAFISSASGIYEKRLRDGLQAMS